MQPAFCLFCAYFAFPQVIELSEVEALLAQNVASRQGQRIKKRSEAVTRGGFLFLRHCLMRFAAGDAHVTKVCARIAKTVTRTGMYCDFALRPIDVLAPPAASMQSTTHVHPRQAGPELY